MILIGDNVNLELEDGNSPPLGTPWVGWHNIVTAAGIAATSSETDNPVTNLANPATHLFWRAEFNTAEDWYLTVTTNTVEELDYLAVAGHNFGSTGITVSVEGRNGSSPDIWQVIVEAAAVEDDLPLVCRFSSQTLTHVRLHIQGGDEVPQAAVMYVGKLLVMERGIDIDTEHVPITYARRSTIVSGMSESGNFVGRTVLKEWRETTAVFEHFTPDWYREFLDPFIEASKETPFFYCWLPLDYPAETGYAWMTNDPQPETSPITRRVNVQLQMRGIA